VERYAHRIGAALALALAYEPTALFCDSWEVEPKGLWAAGFDSVFQDRYGYDVRPFMAALDSHPAARYDYRRLLAAYVLDEFYRPYTALCHRLGGFARVQCHGAPADLLACYAAVDVPESEAILFDPHFSQYAASAAAIAGRPLVSAEAFTCLYGWVPRPGPAPHIKREHPADLALLADALFANGVNMIVWHGMPYNPPGGGNEFYATVHVGPDGALAAHIPALNARMAESSAAMRRGRSYSDVAVYLPLEDNWMRGELPEHLRRPSARYHWELQHQRFPPKLAGYRPLWVSEALLREADYAGGVLRCGEACFSSLYVDVAWLDHAALTTILRLARQGLPVCMKQRPAQPGRNQNAGYGQALAALLALDNVRSSFAPQHPPLVEGPALPEFWCRVDGDEAILFFAHPASRSLSYPLRPGQAEDAGAVEVTVTIHWAGRRVERRLAFAPRQSLLVYV